MAKDAEKGLIDLIVALAPVLQTIIWATVTIYAVMKFRDPLLNLVSHLSTRIRNGDDIRTPWLSIERVRRSESTISNVDSVVHQALSHNERIAEPGMSNLTVLAETISSEIKNNSALTIDTTSFAKGAVWSIGYDSVDSLSTLLDYIYTRLEGIPVFSYGVKWSIKNERTGETIRKMPGAGRSSGYHQDGRLLSEVGIQPGDTLIVSRIVNGH